MCSKMVLCYQVACNCDPGCWRGSPRLIRAPAGAGALEVACSADLKKYMTEVTGRQKLGALREDVLIPSDLTATVMFAGILAFADALLVVPKTLAGNAGHDAQDVVIALEVRWLLRHCTSSANLFTCFAVAGCAGAAPARCKRRD